MIERLVRKNKGIENEDDKYTDFILYPKRGHLKVIRAYAEEVKKMSLSAYIVNMLEMEAKKIEALNNNKNANG